MPGSRPPGNCSAQSSPRDRRAAPRGPRGVCLRGCWKRRYALTATCAAHALGLVPGVEAERRDAVLAAFAALGRRLRTGPEEAARRMLDGAVEKIAAAAREARRAHDLGPDAPLVALGGAAAALIPEVARRLGAGRSAQSTRRSSLRSARRSRWFAPRSCARRTPLRESSLPDRGARLRRGRSGPGERLGRGLLRADEGLLRATATGAVALESGAADRRPVADPSSSTPPPARSRSAPQLSQVSGNDFYRVYAEAARAPSRRGPPRGRRARRPRQAGRGGKDRTSSTPRDGDRRGRGEPRPHPADPARLGRMRPTPARPLRRAPRRGRDERGHRPSPSTRARRSRSSAR